MGEKVAIIGAGGIGFDVAEFLLHGADREPMAGAPLDGAPLDGAPLDGLCGSGFTTSGFTTLKGLLISAATAY